MLQIKGHLLTYLITYFRSLIVTVPTSDQSYVTLVLTELLGTDFKQYITLAELQHDECFII